MPELQNDALFKKGSIKGECDLSLKGEFVRKAIVLFLLLALTAFLPGCAGRPLNWEDIYAGPVPAYEDVIRKHLREVLFDPDSLKDFSIDEPCKEITLTTGYPAFGLRRGQNVYECKYVWYNAKNRMGGYTGKRAHIYFIRNGKVVAGW